MSPVLDLHLDRTTKTPLTEQIRNGISTAISTGVLTPGARLPSWRDLAAQLGVARGTVRAAYERLLDAQLIVSSRTTGTRVADRPAKGVAAADAGESESALPEIYQDFSSSPAIFQMGVPAIDCFPVKLFARIRARAVRVEASGHGNYPDPRGEVELRRQIAAHLALSRSVECLPSQILITAGFTGALGLVLRVLGLEGRAAWLEDPCFPLTRRAVQIAKISTVPVPVDAEGMDVSYGVEHTPDAALAVVTAGQQAPLGATLSLARRLGLLEWAAQTRAWIIEDDYLGELQLRGRAAPALASLDRAGRVIHIGSFSKTISPTLRLGFVVVPPALVRQSVETATCLAPAPGPAVQQATAEFMRDGHYMRHLRRMKRVYAARRDALNACLESRGLSAHLAGLAMLLKLPDDTNDTLIAREATSFGLAPAPLSPWYSDAASRRAGLLLGIATAPPDRLVVSCDRLQRLIERLARSRP
jgi:GntR family transcriptional regulator/MocR family aminotransferase